ncbi:biotin transporter BioY [Candidatus Protochlamydia phocaeensis]|uniref:biotin transporter BioY n=1 Tax=Candidatus Protochlamydia phocaeensis TaxID=1414722 RepID=UPI000838DDFE|nr:biotin transporter BioY [Candidatus Protochlamydia phocaeensis]
MKDLINASLTLKHAQAKGRGYIKAGLSILAGSLFLAAISPLSIELPHTPIPVTLQVFAIFLLILLQPLKQAVCSVLLYLMLATLGFPVLSGGKADAVWYLHASGGYLLGFVCAAYVSGSLLAYKKPSKIGWKIISLTAGFACILILGATWLGYFVGFDQAFAKGVQPFWLGGCLKMIAALLCAYCLELCVYCLKKIRNIFNRGA